MALHEILTDIHTLEQELLEFEARYGVRSETFYAAYASGEEPEDDSGMLDFTEWASVYRTWLARQANPDFLALIAESRMPCPLGRASPRSCTWSPRASPKPRFSWRSPTLKRRTSGRLSAMTPTRERAGRPCYHRGHAVD
jgi:hypothetical protein